MTKSIGIKLALLTVAIAASAAVPAPASAEVQYPWCAQYSERTVGATNCGFVNYRQCRAAISGAGGRCYRNPAYLPRERSRYR